MPQLTIKKKILQKKTKKLSGQTKFSIFCQFEQTKMVIESAILNFIWTKLHRIHGRIVVNACLEYREEMFI